MDKLVSLSVLLLLFSHEGSYLIADGSGGNKGTDVNFGSDDFDFNQSIFSS